ncbi:MAG: hypothetical protein ABFC24_08660 [Methanoregulaceae archaeon]
MTREPKVLEGAIVEWGGPTWVDRVGLAIVYGLFTILILVSVYCEYLLVFGGCP